MKICMCHVHHRYDFSPFTRHTIWTQAIGGSLTIATLMSNQCVLQRLLAVATTREAQRLAGKYYNDCISYKITKKKITES